MSVLDYFFVMKQKEEPDYCEAYQDIQVLRILIQTPPQRLHVNLQLIEHWYHGLLVPNSG